MNLQSQFKYFVPCAARVTQYSSCLSAHGVISEVFCQIQESDEHLNADSEVWTDSSDFAPNLVTFEEKLEVDVVVLKMYLLLVLMPPTGYKYTLLRT